MAYKQKTIGQPKQFGANKFSKKEIGAYIQKLKEFEEKAKVNSNLRYAISEIRKALEQGNLEMATELSAVKSFISGDVNDKYFGEDREYNERVLGEDAYRFLDILHFELSLRRGELPSGMIFISAKGIQQRGMKKGSQHPTLKLMEQSHKEIEEEAKKD